MTLRPLLEGDYINQALAQTCLQKYIAVRDDVYKETRPKLNLNDIVEDDVWRYEKLPEALRPGEGLSKAQLARLVKWKM